MSVYLLPEKPIFPPVEEAEPDGLIAIGGDLLPQRLLNAYACGIFPWFMENDEVFWYSPDPRMVLIPKDYKPGDSLRRIIKSKRFTVTFDGDFRSVIRNCAAAPRPGQEGTWISEGFIEAYTELHLLGFAHSVEVYCAGELAGGLYGVSLGEAFFGESMFYRMNNASKVAFHALVERCMDYRFKFIDCQVESQHLLNLGAVPLRRNDYIRLLRGALRKSTRKGVWKRGTAQDIQNP